MKLLAVIGLVVALGMTEAAMGQAASVPATQPGVTMEQGHPWPVNDMEATKEQLQAKGKWLREQARLEAYPGIGGPKNVDRDQLKKRLDLLRLRYDQFQLDWSEKRARLNAVAKKIAELSAQATDQIAKDPIANELKKAADARDRAAERLGQMVKTGTAAQSDMDAAIATAAEARVKLEERREAVKASVGGGILPDLSKELVDLSIDKDVTVEEEKSFAMTIYPLQEALEKLEELDHVEQVLAARFHVTIDG